LGGWTFENIENNFDTHVRKSVPGYDLSHEIICLLSDPFLRNSSSVLDIGCSTGTLLKSIYERHSSRELHLIGIDMQESMIKFAQTSSHDLPIEFHVSNIESDSLGANHDVIISTYTLQFIPPSVRQNIVNKIYTSLNWGGGFFLFEKVRAPDARFQDYINHAFVNYKLKHFDPEEVVGKANSLVGVMEPFSSQGNIDMLSRAGFNDICTVSKLLCFEGFLAIK